jgi:hypothetical protein
MSICTVKSWFEVLVVVFALMSAGFWFAAPRYKRPRCFVCRSSGHPTVCCPLHAGLPCVCVEGVLATIGRRIEYEFFIPKSAITDFEALWKQI